MRFVDSQIIAGADWIFTEYFSDYSALEYTCVLLLKLGSGDVKTVETTADGSGFAINEAAASTAITQGNYQYQYKFTKILDNSVYVPQEHTGRVQVTALLSSGGDLRTNDEKYYDALIASRQTVIERDYVEVNTGGGKSAKFRSLEELNTEIERMEVKLGIRKPNRVLSQFK